MSVCTSVHKN